MSEFVALRVAVVTVSDTRDEESDTSGAAVAAALIKSGHSVAEKIIVSDTLELLGQTFKRLIASSEVDVIISTGGTGLTRRDITPEAIEPFITKTIPGFGELFRWISFEEIGTSTIQSRAMAALCGSTLAFLLPGSTGAVKTAMGKILNQQLDSRHTPCNFVELLPRIRP